MTKLSTTNFHLVIALLLTITTCGAQAIEITVNGLFKGGAVLAIDGQHRLLRVGDRSPEGVELIAVSSDSATFKYGEDEQTLGMNRSISTQFSAPDKAQTRIASSQGGHYVTPGRINGLPVMFMVDTGATAVAINLPNAKALGVNYRAGNQISVQTANGVTSAYTVTLDSVRVGDVEVLNVAAIVSMSDYPAEILLGNSFLSRVDMRRENGVLVLESRYGVSNDSTNGQ